MSARAKQNNPAAFNCPCDILEYGNRVSDDENCPCLLERLTGCTSQRPIQTIGHSSRVKRLHRGCKCRGELQTKTPFYFFLYCFVYPCTSEKPHPRLRTKPKSARRLIYPSIHPFKPTAPTPSTHTPLRPAPSPPIGPPQTPSLPPAPTHASPPPPCPPQQPASCPAHC